MCIRDRVTSTNAKQIVESFPKDEKIIFGPDRNLGNYINSVTNRQMLLWDGACHVHEQFSVEKILELKAQYPDDFARIIEITYRFSYGWRRIHNPDSGEDVADDLTTTEFTMAMLACRGWTNAEIARHMGVSPGTVKNRLSGVYAKLGIGTRAELVAHMLR